MTPYFSLLGTYIKPAIFFNSIESMFEFTSTFRDYFKWTKIIMKLPEILSYFHFQKETFIRFLDYNEKFLLDSSPVKFAYRRLEFIYRLYIYVDIYVIYTTITCLPQFRNNQQNISVSCNIVKSKSKTCLWRAGKLQS